VNTIFFGHHVNTLIAALHGHAGIPARPSQLLRAEGFELSRFHIIRESLKRRLIKHRL
jgi:hypothetical protein